MLIACQSDAEGCGKKADYPQRTLWEYVLTECTKVNSQTVIDEGYSGEAIKQEMHKRRVACVELILNLWKKNEK
jgi:tRNA nucleotidyltransferase (CCA-adding enzyme)